MKYYTHDPEITKPFPKNGSFTLGDMKYPRNWLMTMSDEDIAAMGLVEYVEPPAEPKTAQDYPLQAWQFHSMIEDAGLDIQIRSAINGMADGMDKKVAMQKLERTTIFNRNDGLVVTLSAALGLTPEEVDVLWMSAKDLM